VWADQTEVHPIDRTVNPYRDKWNLGNRFVVMYSGNFGLGHDVDTMCQAALRLRDDDSIRFVFAGDGKKKEIVDRFVREHELSLCILAPFQPRESLDASLSCADVHLASLLEGVEGIMVPSKLFGVMAAERPTIFIGHPASELALILTENECGVVVRQGDVDGLVSAILALSKDVRLCKEMGRNARKALIQSFNREHACEQWRALLETLDGATRKRVTADSIRDVVFRSK
jgi:glycosyltransferase involved in cell wall biosynthesis